MSTIFCNENGTINRQAVRAAIRKEFDVRFNYFYIQNNYPKSHGQPLRLARRIIAEVKSAASSEQHDAFVNPRFQREVESEYTPAERRAVDSADSAAACQPVSFFGNQRAKEYGTEAGIIRGRVHKRALDRIRSEINRAA